MDHCWVYILASKRDGTLYVGLTSDLAARIHAHREGAVQGFTKKHGVKLLVHVEEFQELDETRSRERLVKRWNRAWKLDLIEDNNPQWRDLYEDIQA
jgi:putative endonuclease